MASRISLRSCWRCGGGCSSPAGLVGRRRGPVGGRGCWRPITIQFDEVWIACVVLIAVEAKATDLALGVQEVRAQEGCKCIPKRRCVCGLVEQEDVREKLAQLCSGLDLLEARVR